MDIIRGSIQVGNTTPSNPEICLVHHGSIADVALELVNDVVVEGSFAYCVAPTDGGSGLPGYLTIVDVSDPANPSLETGGFVLDLDLEGAQQLVKDGDYCYVAAAGAGGIAVVDVSDPTTPVVVGAVTDPELNGAQGIAKSGNYLFVTDPGDGLLTVVDVSTPASPFVEGSIATVLFSNPEGVAISGTWAFVASYGNDRLVAVDISDPTDPSPTIHSITDSTLDAAFGVTIQGNLALVAGGGNILSIVDISNPAAMSVLSYWNFGTPITSVVATATRAYIASPNTDEVFSLNISNPSAPALLSAPYDTSGTITQLDSAQDLALAGGRLYVAASNGDRLTVLGC